MVMPTISPMIPDEAKSASNRLLGPKLTPYQRLLGLMPENCYTRTSVQEHTEMDLSAKQWLDILIIQRSGEGLVDLGDVSRVLALCRPQFGPCVTEPSGASTVR